MAEASDTEGILRQNLIDAGCDPEIVQQCMELARGQRTEEMKRVLTRHRRTLLDTVHAEQKKRHGDVKIGAHHWTTGPSRAA